MNENKIKIPSIKLGLLGDSPVGKTCIFNAFQGLAFEGTIPTIGYDKTDCTFKLENAKEIKVILYDTTGKERFLKCVLQVFRQVHGIILVFDVTLRSSFDNIDNWIKIIETNFRKPSVVLFGNKADLDKKDWEVTDEEV